MAKSEKGPVAALYKRLAKDREPLLEEARFAAAMTKPWILPPDGHEPDDKLPEKYQSIGSRGVSNLAGRMMTAMWPPDSPWFRQMLAPEIRFGGDTDAEQIQAAQDVLMQHDLMAQAMLESANLQQDGRRRRAGFRSTKRAVMLQLLITGDTLEHLNDDYRLRLFSRDQYVTQRDSRGDVLQHVIHERVDPLSRPDEDLNAAGLSREDLRKKPVDERMTDLYTRVEWQPESKRWLTVQEMEGSELPNQSEDAVSPYFSTPFELGPNANYGVGLIDSEKGDLRSTNELELRFLDWASIHSKIVPVVDPTSNARPKDLAKKSGEPIEARVAGGQVQDIGMLVPPTAAQFAAVAQAADRKTQQLAGAFLLESELQPHQERVTAAQIRRIALELEGALGGIYTPIADDQQEPLIRRVLWQMRRDGLLPPLPDEGIEIRLLTGIAALAREIDRANLLNVMQTILAIPGAAERVNFDILIDLVMRWSGIYEPGLIKDVEQARQERLELQQEAVAGAAAQQAIETTGAIAEEQATQQIQGAQ